jgi:hypothetical protein
VQFPSGKALKRDQAISPQTKTPQHRRLRGSGLGLGIQAAGLSVVSCLQLGVAAARSVIGPS